MNILLERRHQRTLAFLKSCVNAPAKILDLGVDNLLAQRMRDSGYDVVNTPELDLDYSPEVVNTENVDLVTAFEILEHLVNPFGVLTSIAAPRLIATVPLRLWFASAYRNPRDIFDQHYHEFEPWQFERLLEKAGWQIVRSEQWKSPNQRIGIRPLLRYFAPRYFAVEAERKSNPEANVA